MRRQANRTEEWRIITVSRSCGPARLRYTPIGRSNQSPVDGSRRRRLCGSLPVTAVTRAGRAAQQRYRHHRRHASPQASAAPCQRLGLDRRHATPGLRRFTPLWQANPKPITSPGRCHALFHTASRCVSGLGTPKIPFTSYYLVSKFLPTTLAQRPLEGCSAKIENIERVRFWTYILFGLVYCGIYALFF